MSIGPPRRGTLDSTSMHTLNGDRPGFASIAASTTLNTMPELPDLVVYEEALQSHVMGSSIEKVRLGSPFVVRSVEPEITAIERRVVTGVRRLGKQLVLSLEEDLHLVLHLMIAGRLRWKERGVAIPKKRGLAAFDFSRGSLLLTEASTQRRASIRLVCGPAALDAFDRGGLEVLQAGPDEFRSVITRENHTLKRALTDPTMLSGIGNAYSDEILHAARLSPLALTLQLTEEEIERLYRATCSTLIEWTERLRREARGAFPDKVRAFHPDMAVHGRYRMPCPVCDAPIQRIRYAQTEVNYCAQCQTGGRVLADRAMSRLLKKDWPRSLEEWEERLGG